MSSEKILGPTFIGIGGMKCGTTWLSECLRYHPEVFMSIPKELHFFGLESNWNKGIDWYLGHFKESQGYKAIGEFSTSYLQDPLCADRIQSIIGQVKIMVLLRNPIGRFISHYKHLIRGGKLRKREYHVLDIDALHKATSLYPQLISKGQYCDSLKIYIEKFGFKNICIVIKDDMDKNHEHEIRKVYEFLGVNSEFVPPILNKEVSSGIIPRVQILEAIRIRLFYILTEKTPGLVKWIQRLRLAEIYRKLNSDKRPNGFKIDEKVIKELTLYYHEDITNIEQLLGRKLNAWRQ
jgi:sulfotransferase family protein